MNVVNYDQKIGDKRSGEVYITFGKGVDKNRVFLVIQGKTGGVGTGMSRNMYNRFLDEAIRKEVR